MAKPEPVKIVWHTKELEGRIIELAPKIAVGIRAMLEYWRPRVEGQAKSGAPWTDRTGNARNGLTATVGGGSQERDSTGRFTSGSKNTFTLSLAHSVPYGVYLETRWSGRYAIIMPTINNFAPEVFRSMDGLLGRLE